MLHNKLREILGECGLDAPNEDEIQDAIKEIKALVIKSLGEDHRIAKILFKSSIYIEMYGGWQALPTGHKRVFIKQEEAIIIEMKERWK